LINVRLEQVQHEFVNTKWVRLDRIKFDVEVIRCNHMICGIS